MSYHHATCNTSCTGVITGTTSGAGEVGGVGPARLAELIGDEMNALGADRHRHIMAIRDMAATSPVIVHTSPATSARILIAALTGLEEVLIAWEADFTRRYTGHLTDTTTTTTTSRVSD